LPIYNVKVKQTKGTITATKEGNFFKDKNNVIQYSNLGPKEIYDRGIKLGLKFPAITQKEMSDYWIKRSPKDVKVLMTDFKQVYPPLPTKPPVAKPVDKTKPVPKPKAIPIPRPKSAWEIFWERIFPPKNPMKGIEIPQYESLDGEYIR